MVVFKKRTCEIQFKNAFLFWKTPEYNYKTTTVLLLINYVIDNTSMKC